MEFVWVVKREDLFRGRTPHGLERLDAPRMDQLCAGIRDRGFFVERRHAERDWTLKQPIPYCVIRRGGEILRTRRLAKGGEKRLHGKRSIGIGGHLNPVDAADACDGASDLLANGLRREIEEELVVRGTWTARPLGLLNDDTTEVGAVHVGLVHLVDVEGDVSIRETDALEGEFVAAEEILRSCREDRAGWETWSALVIESGAL